MRRQPILPATRSSSPPSLRSRPPSRKPSVSRLKLSLFRPELRPELRLGPKPMSSSVRSAGRSPPLLSLTWHFSTRSTCLDASEEAKPLSLIECRYFLGSRRRVGVLFRRCRSSSCREQLSASLKSERNSPHGLVGVHNTVAEIATADYVTAQL